MQPISSYFLLSKYSDSPSTQTMASKELAAAHRTLRIFFLPYLSPGHMIPMLDIAKLFARRGSVAATVITTPGNEPLVRPAIDIANANPDIVPIELVLIPFPSSVAPLLKGRENFAAFPSADHIDFFTAFMALQGPFDEFIRANQPDCIVSDAAMLAWSTDTAAALRVPRIIFYGPGIFVHCVHESIEMNSPHLKVADPDATFIVEGLPHRVEMTRREVSSSVDNPVVLKMMREGEDKSYGVIVNSFFELEEEYAELYRRSKPGRRAYYVGPVSLSNKDERESADRGQKINSEVTECTVKWLDSMEKRSVMYVSFGSLNEFSAAQLREIAVGMEESGWPFVWVVKGSGEPDWLPTGFEERVKGKGIVIRGWAPQMVILNHPAVGGFLTHCGWNSTLESVCAGVPMVAWPVEWDQFVIEKLIVQVLEIGVSVGRSEVVKAEQIVKAVGDVMGNGEEAERRRARVKKYAALAKEASEEGGSSYGDITRLIDELQCARDSLDVNGVLGKANSMKNHDNFVSSCS